ncbi:ATP-binding protein [Catellatospora sp. KI3]|uniref:ATP-binding protein n=1 Tax=Catellatospora sp. KI3 TaxID=3041620 RepID=UPI00248311A5|nr:ATP-binding protein [Catellatospora sp. KI3]MDI1460680.1 ATP-binding protein [Catellatospora sp. KI3]
MVELGVTVTDCLADQPDGVLLDLTAAPCLDPRLPAWLLGMARTARRWPGAPLLVAAPPAWLTGIDGITTYAETADAVATARQLPAAPRRSLRLPPVAPSCAAARDLAWQACHDFGLRRPAQIVRLLASELAANAIVHARTELQLTLRAVPGGIDVAVRDGDPFPPQAPGPHDAGGGLELVSALSRDWGCLLTSDGKVVWARVEVLSDQGTLRRAPA